MKWNRGFLLFLVFLDFIRGFMHTFLNEFAALNIARIDPNPDALYLLGAFGISNFVTSFIFFMIWKKAKHLSPYVLITVFAGYVFGILGMQVGRTTMESAFNGQYMMYAYLVATLVFPVLYFTGKDDKNSQYDQEIE